MTHYRFIKIDGQQIFYREAGSSDKPALLLLHGFPSSSHMYRELIPLLAEQYHVIAPDLPGFGFSEAPDRAYFAYTFDHLAEVIRGFVDSVGLTRYALYVFDYGAPVGLRLMAAQPERITALISQNGNAYLEGLSDGWAPIQRYWQAPTPENRAALQMLLTLETTRWQYTHGVEDESCIAPEAYQLDAMLMQRPGNSDIQLDLFLDYASNVELYPQFQATIREFRIPVLAAWGKHDPFFLPAGAEAFKRDSPGAEIHLLDTGHFALETHAQEIASLARDFLAKNLGKESAQLS